LKDPVSAVVPAAGLGRRLGSRTPKTYLPVSGKPLFIHTLLALKKAYAFHEIVLVVEGSRLLEARSILLKHKIRGVSVASGGATRAESVLKGILALSHENGLVAVHDAARPLVSKEVVRRTVEAAQNGPSAGSGRCAGAVCVEPVSSTIKRVDAKGRILRTEDRDRLVLAQTPQVFRRKALLDRYKALGKRAFIATDEAALFDGTGAGIRTVAGDEKNVKITTKTDFERFKKSL
jgi:2-C-methyl-D-erythritol 4-phosphate cytidylyltransferase